MKILMLGWELPPHNSGGLGVACYHLSKALALAGASIDFVLPYTAHHPDTEFMKIHSVTKISPSVMYTNGAYNASQSAELSVAKLQESYCDFVSDLVRRDKPDVIHAHDWLTMQAGAAAKRACGAPLVVHVHATEFERAGGNDGNPIVHEIEQEALLLADRILAVSQLTRQIIIDRYHIPAGKVEVAHNALDPASLGEHEYDMRTYAYLESLKDEGYCIVSSVGRLTLMKGLVQFLQAAALACSKYDKFAFLLAGDGEQRDQLISLAADLGIADKVLFSGFVRGQQWRDAYSVSDVFVMNSSSEPFGLSALEAAHYDNAIILSKQAGVGEVLSHVLRADYWDIERLADQLVGIATSSTLGPLLRQNVRTEYARLSWKDVAHKCLEVYEKVQEKVGVLV